ncbi:hypothetical protein GPECTOR_73g652 [Gonium pectorale]|uniref:NmrA-like domain-containing protein n=1 Tax=Gonium pectorale TaxID=33097 RepID=A0A150G2W4_GONPE|nr:hypothetical protein GPECTOR_73g652 [Gonium pectorale]|eukprot:KXZ44131.1 hypothetical protein GPECTOR_73g652 [Gonium pectorale]
MQQSLHSSGLAGQRLHARRGVAAFAPVRSSVSRSTRVRVFANATAAAAASGTPVPKNTVLVVGATGTLGRQIVRRALDDGYDVRCLVRPRPNPADFLRDWGAKVVNGDLTDPASLPACLVGVSTVIDCATARPEESTRKVDWEGKVALIQSAQAMGIQRYVYFSIFDCEKHPEVPLMNIKSCTEKFLESSGLDFTTFRLCGFHQVRIGDKTSRRTLTLSGPKAWTTREVIELCEKMADTNAKVTTVPTWLLKRTRAVLRSLQWAADAADRLAFAEVLSNNEVWSADMAETYRLLDMDPGSVTTLESYLQDYFSRILKKLKEVGAAADRTNFYV